LQRTTLKAPVAGIVSRKSVELGQVIQPGQPLMTIIPLDRVWITANFKETQLRDMRVGQTVIAVSAAHLANARGSRHSTHGQRWSGTS